MKGRNWRKCSKCRVKQPVTNYVANKLIVYVGGYMEVYIDCPNCGWQEVANK